MTAHIAKCSDSHWAPSRWLWGCMFPWLQSNSPISFPSYNTGYLIRATLQILECRHSIQHCYCICMFKYIRNLKNNPQFHIVFFFLMQIGEYLSSLVIRYICFVWFTVLKQKLCANLSVSATTTLCVWESLRRKLLDLQSSLLKTCQVWIGSDPEGLERTAWEKTKKTKQKQMQFLWH